jgi:hypothetical protein
MELCTTKELMCKAVSNHFYSAEWNTKYIYTFYNAILILTGNDVGPPSDLMRNMGIFLLCTGSLMSGNVLGTMSTIFQSMNRTSAGFQNKLDLANTSMLHMHLPEKV